MALAVTEDQVALAESVTGWAERAKVRAQSREQVDVPALNRPARRPAWWPGAVELGLTGLALPEDLGGSGAGVVELAVAIEELGRHVAHGPLVPSSAAGLVLLASRLGQSETKAIDALLSALAEGEATAAVALDAGRVTASESAGELRLSGDAGLVLGLPGAEWLLVSASGPSGEFWAALDVGAGVAVEPVDSLDVTRPLARVTLTDAVVPADRVLAGVDTDLVRDLHVTVAAAEAAGIARWAQETATAYAKVREQFGRPIGSFQSIKHLCSDMLARTELAAAAAWDAASAATSFLESGDPTERRQLAVAAATAGSVALQDAVLNAKDCIQIHGGIGFTWEHDAHLSLRRAMAVRALSGGTASWNAKVTALGRSGLRRHRKVAIGTEADPLRRQVREVLASLPAEGPERRNALADAGLIAPHWPKPYGLSASPVEQVAIAEELLAAGVQVPDLIIGNWAIPTIIEHGNDEQRERFVTPTLTGEIAWCQLFSEPGAGSDLASLRTKATKVDGGWSLQGQKVWTSLARQADWGICLARTNPDAPHHKGITYFLVDMKTKGIDVRPLREITGEALFNEVFLDDVFVRDDCVVGQVDGGWRLARTTLANERVAMSSTNDIGGGLDGLLETSMPDPVLDDRIGALVGGLQAAGALGLQITLRQLGGLDPGPSSSVRKLVGMYQIQDARELALEALGLGGADMSQAASFAAAIPALSTRALTIAGGSSQVLRNVIAERLLGLPRD